MHSTVLVIYVCSIEVYTHLQNRVLSQKKERFLEINWDTLTFIVSQSGRYCKNRRTSLYPFFYSVGGEHIEKIFF
jgi:hypothetical protein